jgi:hypothetical protein
MVASEEQQRAVIAHVARVIGLSGPDLGGLLALIELRNQAERLSKGLLEGTVTATYAGPTDADGAIPPASILCADQYTFAPKVAA